jgi:hypothetical protein
MSGTLITLKAILGEAARPNIWSQFAMINAAKCCYGNMESVPDRLYWNCADFGLQELRILKPDILVTQGKNAQEPVKVPELPFPDRAAEIAKRYLAGSGKPELLSALEWMIDRHIHEIDFGERKCFWLQTPHPSDRRGSWAPFRNVFLPVLGRIIHELAIGSNP